MFSRKDSSLHVNTDPLGISFYSKQSPFPSPSSSSSSSTNQIHSPTKCQLIKNNQNISSPNKLTPKSWENIKSPAASFLAGFSFSPCTSEQEVVDEEAGDEIDDYVIDKIIGYGGFSIVREGYRISDGQKVAIKIISKSNEEQVQKELNIWKSLNHENVVQLHKILETDSKYFIICDFCQENLLNQLKLKKEFTEAESKRVFYQLCQAILYLHEVKKICHKDLKLENVLLLNDCIKLCDFGLAIYQQPLKLNPMTQLPLSPQLNDNVHLAGGSLAYASPEQIQSKYAIPYPSTDIWSLGIILYALVTGKLPFHDDFDLRLQQKILNGKYDDLPSHLSNDLKDLIHGCLASDPLKRYTIHQILNSNWLKNM